VYYQQQRDQGKAHQAAVRALAFQWIRILYRCWQDRTLYDESVYLNALNNRGSSLIHQLAQGERCRPDARLIRGETIQRKNFFAKTS
jgi:hypothetical protein